MLGSSGLTLLHNSGRRERLRLDLDKLIGSRVSTHCIKFGSVSIEVLDNDKLDFDKQYLFGHAKHYYHAILNKVESSSSGFCVNILYWLARNCKCCSLSDK